MQLSLICNSERMSELLYNCFVVLFFITFRHEDAANVTSLFDYISLNKADAIASAFTAFTIRADNYLT